MKLVPENDHEQMLVNAVIGLCRGYNVFYLDDNECWIPKDKGRRVATIWTDSVYKVETDAPIKIIWEVITPQYQWAAMDKRGEVFIYMDKPKLDVTSGVWYPEADSYENNDNYLCISNHMYVETDNINWETSLTKRPEDK